MTRLKALAAAFLVAWLGWMAWWISQAGPPPPGTRHVPVVPMEDDPAGVDLLVTYNGDARTFEALVDGLGEAPLGATSPGELLGALAGLASPVAGARAGEVAVAFMRGRGPALAAARFARLPEGWRLEDDGGPHAPARVVAGELRPWSARWVPTLPGDGGTVVLARDPDDLEVALRWLAFSVLEEAGEALRIEVPARRAATQALPWLEARLDDALGDARRSIAAERRARDGAPALGDPEALVDAFEARVRALLAWMPDVGTVRIRLWGSPAGVELDVRASVAAESPLARALAAAEPAPVGWAALPGDTAFALQSRGRLGDVLAEVAGARLPEAARDGLMTTMPAGVWTFGLGTSPWLRLAPAPAPGAVDRFVASAYGGGLLGALLGCERASPGEVPCPGVSRRDGPPEAPALELLRAPAAPESLDAVPAAARVVGDATPGLTHLYLDPDGLPAALRVVGALTDLPALARRGQRRPLGATLRYEPLRHALVLEVRAAPGALPALRRLAALVSE